MLIIIYCSGYMTGSDWRTYELWYEEASLTSIGKYGKEPGYYILMIIFKSIGFGFFYYTILLKTLILCAFSYFFRKEFSRPKLELFALFLLITLEGPFIFINAPFRNIISLGIFLFAYSKFYEQKFKKYLALCLLACTIHYSMVLILIISIFVKVYKRKFSNKLIFSIYIASIIFSAFPLFFKDMLFYTKGISIYLDSKFESYVYTNDFNSRPFISLGSFINIAFFIFIYSKRKFLNRYIYLFSIIDLVFYRLYIAIPLFSRFYLYLIPFFIVALIQALASLKISIYNIVVYVYAFAILVTTVLSNFAYLPYSNYWYFWLNDDLKSYNYRSNYNISAWIKKYHEPISGSGKK